MKFIEAEVENTRRSAYKNLKDELSEFMKMNVKSAKVTFTESEYSCSTAARVALSQAIKTNCFPIKVKTANGNVYLVRTDL